MCVHLLVVMVVMMVTKPFLYSIPSLDEILDEKSAEQHKEFVQLIDQQVTVKLNGKFWEFGSIRIIIATIKQKTCLL